MTRYRNHLVDDVLRWWMANGPDEEHGGVLTCWDNAGRRLLSHDKYTWSQGRWAWLMAEVALAAPGLGIDAGPYAEQARRTAVFLRDHAVLPDGTTAFVTDRAGVPHESAPGTGLHTSVFSDLFASLGWAGVARLERDGDWGALALRMLLDAAARIRTGSFRSEPYPVAAGHRSFGLPMILLGVGEQVYRATGDPRAAAVVRAAGDEIAEHHLDGDDVAEMPRLDEADDGSLLTRHRTPGHVLESLWFAHHARDLLDGPLAETATLGRIAVHALRLGWDEGQGGLLRYTDRDGGVPTGTRTADRYEQLVVDTWDTKLWWPHAEALYTTHLLAGAGSDPTLAAWSERVADYTMRTFPDGPGQEWTQIRTRDGSPLEATVALPVKDPFHVARALLLLAQLERDHLPHHLQEAR